MPEIAAPTLQAWADHMGIAPAELDVSGLHRFLADGTIPDVLSATASSHPRATLEVAGERVTHRELHSLAARQATVLAGLNVSRGTRVVINAPTSMALIVAYLAAQHLGAVVVLTNPTYTAHELEFIVDRSAAELVLVHDQFEHSISARVQRLSTLADASDGAAAHERVVLDSRNVALLAFTSGTTGSPKAVPLTHMQLLASIRAAMLAWRWSENDTLIHALPLFHQHGLSGIHASLLAGSNAVVLARFEPEEMLAAVARENATVMFAVPSIHQRFAQLDAARLKPLRELRLITSGSAPLPPMLATTIKEKTGLAPLERYGLTETGLNVSNSFDGERAIGTVGYPLPGVEVRLTDPHGGAVDAGAEGEIVLRGPQVFDGYLDDTDATQQAFWPGGWFRSGDLGRWDYAGRLVISGRLKDLVITGGMNVSPNEVEGVLEQFVGIKEAAVAGLPSDKWGEEVAAWVVVDGTSTVDAELMTRHCRAHLAAYKCPKQFFYVDELPRNAMGKVTRGRLRPAPS